VRLEGTLDAFSLPDIFQLLSYTKKTGTLHLRCEDRHGVVHLRDGSVTGACSDVGRQELARRLVGSGLVDDEALAAAAEQVAEQDSDGGAGLATLLVQRAGLDAALVAGLAAEQATDAVFDLLRWSDGEFAFLIDEAVRDDLGAVLPVEEVVAEGRRRLELWGSLVDSVPSAGTVLRLHQAPPADPMVSRDEWSLLSLVDGHRSVADLVGLAGRGEYAVVSALAGLVARGLLVSSSPIDDQLQRRQALLAALEGRSLLEPVPVPELVTGPELVAVPPSMPLLEPVPAPSLLAPAPADGVRTAVIPQRREPFVPARRPEHAEHQSSAQNGSTLVGVVDGATALQAQGAPAVPPYIEHDQSVNKTLLLRLIAGVRGL
jgi:hypothetical protein